MKEIEELLDKMLLCSEEHLQSGVNEPTKYAELRAEIIKRFDELEKFYKHTHKVEYVAGITRPYEQKIAELEAQVEKMKKAIAIRDRIME
jgi:5'-deoxynucleotidase YfbR-like HD superfamily hydrolase